jgi:hypothetical protein
MVLEAKEKLTADDQLRPWDQEQQPSRYKCAVPRIYHLSIGHSRFFNSVVTGRGTRRGYVVQVILRHERLLGPSLSLDDSRTTRDGFGKAVSATRALAALITCEYHQHRFNARLRHERRCAADSGTPHVGSTLRQHLRRWPRLPPLWHLPSDSQEMVATLPSSRRGGAARTLPPPPQNSYPESHFSI